MDTAAVHIALSVIILELINQLPHTAPLSVVQRLLESTAGVVMINKDDKNRINEMFVVGQDDIMEIMNTNMRELI